MIRYQTFEVCELELIWYIKKKSRSWQFCILSEVKHFHLATADLFWHGEASIEAWGACYFPSRHLIRVHVTFYNWTDHWSWNVLNTDIHSIDIFTKERTFCPILRKCLPTWVLVEACTDQLYCISRQVLDGKLYCRTATLNVSFHKKKKNCTNYIYFAI